MNRLFINTFKLVIIKRKHQFLNKFQKIELNKQKC